MSKEPLEYQINEIHGDEWLAVPEQANYGMDDLTASAVAEAANDEAAGELFEFSPGCTEPHILLKIRKEGGGPYMAFYVYAEPSISYHAMPRDEAA